MDYLIVLSQIHYWPLYNKDKVTVLQAGEVSHKLIENLDIVTYYAFRIVANDDSGGHHYCEVLARTLRDGEFCFILEIKTFIGLLFERTDYFLPSLLRTFSRLFTVPYFSLRS